MQGCPTPGSGTGAGPYVIWYQAAVRHSEKKCTLVFTHLLHAKIIQSYTFTFFKTTGHSDPDTNRIKDVLL